MNGNGNDRTYDPRHGSADWLFQNGTIYTVDAEQPTAEVVAVRGREIVYVGDADGAADWRGPNTRVVDLADRMLLPGFIDGHDHLASLGITKLGVNIGGLHGKDAVLQAIREWIATQPADAPLRGHGWATRSTFGAEHPRREWLDEVTGDRPMYVLNADMHETWFNTAAMKAAGISAETPDLQPGVQFLHRALDGTPSGLAVEGASLPILIACGMTSPESIREAQRRTLDVAPAMGMTTYVDCGMLVGVKNAAAAPVWVGLIDRDNAGDLPVRIVGTVWTRAEEDDPAAIAAELVDWSSRFRSEHVQIKACKMWTDGTFPNGSAKLLEPFCDDSPGGDSMLLSPEHIEAQIEAVHLAGFDMHVHCDADGTVRAVLDAFENVIKRHGLQGLRHTMCHLSLVHPDDIPRFAQLGIIVNGTPIWATDYNGVDYDRYQCQLGAERFEERLLPYGDIMRTGAVVTFGADIGGVDIDEVPPLIQISAALTRKRPGHPDDRPMVARQRITLDQAIRAYTINGAYQARLEDMVGSIEVGKLADLVVLGANLFEVAPEYLHEVPVLLTLMDGHVRHDALND